MIAEETLCVRVNGMETRAPATFRLTNRGRQALRQTYFELDQLARQPGASAAYRQKEGALGRELAGFLFGTGGTAGPSAALAECLTALRGNDYVRLLLRIDTPALVDLPWELALWNRPGTDEEIHIGRDPRIALSRLERGSAEAAAHPVRAQQGILRAAGVLSIFNIGADSSREGVILYERTRDFVRLIDEHIPRLHTASRRGADLERYWLDSVKLTGQEPEIDIVHWRGHGGGLRVGVATDPRAVKELDATELFQRTRGAFLYVVIACESGGAASGAARPASFSAALLEAGASAVLGTHDAVAREEFAYLPIFYPLLFQGVPLDYCVQYLRRFFTLMNEEHRRGPYDRWYKLILHTTSTWYLDGTPAITPSPRQGDPLEFVPILRNQLMRLLYVSHERRMRELDAVLTKLHPELDDSSQKENIMSDQWDPKYPKDLQLWSESYSRARAELSLESSPWRPAFTAVVEADASGAFAAVKELYRGTMDLWDWRQWLWDTYFVPMFEQDRASWPSYVQAVHDAVPGDWLGMTGALAGIPTPWHVDARKVWAFKSTVLFVAGLIEGELPLGAEPGPLGGNALVAKRTERRRRS